MTPVPIFLNNRLLAVVEGRLGGEFYTKQAEQSKVEAACAFGEFNKLTYSIQHLPFGFAKLWNNLSLESAWMLNFKIGLQIRNFQALNRK